MVLVKKELVTPEVAEALDLWLSNVKGDKQEILNLHTENCRFRAYSLRVEPLNYIVPNKMERILERGYERFDFTL
jgi:hypothetical protein